MISAQLLLTDLIRLLKRVEDDLRQRIADVAELKASLQAEWQAARDANRNAETFESWADQVITQAGVHWLLSCVFLRFIEDNQLVDRPWISGTPESGRLTLARDRHEAYFRTRPLESDSDYLLACFREASTLPGLNTFFDEAHNPVFRLCLSGEAAMAVRQFWQQVDPNTGTLVHDFADPGWNTRFLGDLYQDLSEATRKRYALLQTPEFVEEFILDRTLTPAIREFGFREARMIDPTCGSGHFLLGGFHRLVDEWARAEPGHNRRDVAQKALDAVAGVDLNPFAVAIARFRLLVAALQVSEVRRLTDAPNFQINVAIGDSLLHGTRFGMTGTQSLIDEAASHANTGLAHAYASEDLADVQRILGVQYHAVVGNPPYIVAKDAALNAAYRQRYASCHMKYSLGAPFTERFFELANTGQEGQSAGYIGLITTNSFMKREFGSKLIEQVLPKLDLSHVIDTSGAYIPGHGTPTVILFGRHRPPVSAFDPIRTVMGIKSEPFAPDDPANGLVWRAILRQIDEPGSESAFVTVADTPRPIFARHPWSIGGGGAADVKDAIDSNSAATLGQVTDEIGVFGMTNADDVMLAPHAALRRFAVEVAFSRPLIVGDIVRDWIAAPCEDVLFPYCDGEVAGLKSTPGLAKWLWPCRTLLGNRVTFGKSTYFAEGRPWWEWHQITLDRIKTSLTITLAFVATHNHFVLDRGGRVFSRSAPVIKLPVGATDDEHLGILGVLNSSTACFWLQQICHNKGRPGADVAGADERYEMRFEFDSTKLAQLPLVDERPRDIAMQLDTMARQLIEKQPTALLAASASGTQPLPTRASLDVARDQAAQIRRLMITRQEEMDWRCYRLYGLLPAGVGIAEVEHDAPVEVALGERAFEIVLARRMAGGKEQTTWFQRHGSAPITEIPVRWPEGYRQVVARRIELIEHIKAIGLIERPEFKRRWNSPKWEDLEQAALRDWLLARLESPVYFFRTVSASADQRPRITTTNRLADAVQRDAEFMQIAELYSGHADFDLAHLVAELVTAESVSFLPVQRFTDTGLRKRAQWEDTWALQRQEDRIDAQVDAEADGLHTELMAQSRQTYGTDTSQAAIDWVNQTLAVELARHKAERKQAEVGKIPVPPKYQNKDFQKTDVWRLRGGLDVPKERWVSYPGCERGADGSLPIAWAGWDHLQQATALAGYYVDMKETEGWEPSRLQPLLAGLLELVPWLEQWHNQLDPAYGERMGTYYKGFVTEEARELGFTLDDLRAWKPVTTAAKRARKKIALAEES